MTRECVCVCGGSGSGPVGGREERAAGVGTGTEGPAEALAPVSSARAPRAGQKVPRRPTPFLPSSFPRDPLSALNRSPWGKSGVSGPFRGRQLPLPWPQEGPPWPTASVSQPGGLGLGGHRCNGQGREPSCFRKILPWPPPRALAAPRPRVPRLHPQMTLTASPLHLWVHVHTAISVPASARLSPAPHSSWAAAAPALSSLSQTLSHPPHSASLRPQEALPACPRARARSVRSPKRPSEGAREPLRRGPAALPHASLSAALPGTSSPGRPGPDGIHSIVQAFPGPSTPLACERPQLPAANCLPPG